MTPRNAKLGRRIREARNRAGLSQERLAELVGTHRRHVIRWEQGIHVPTGVYAERLAEVLKEREGFVEEEIEERESEAFVSELMLSLRNYVAAEVQRAQRQVEA